MTDLTDFYQAFRDEGYCTDCWVEDDHDEKCPLYTSENPEVRSDSEVSQ